MTGIREPADSTGFNTRFMILELNSGTGFSNSILELGRRQGAVAVLRHSPKNIDRPRVKGAFHRLSSGRRPGRIEAITLLAGKRPPDRKRSESAVTNPADDKANSAKDSQACAADSGGEKPPQPQPSPIRGQHRDARSSRFLPRSAPVKPARLS